MNKLIQLLIIVVFMAVKLIVTGICLAIGFSLGGIVMNKVKHKYETNKKKPRKEDIPVAV
jgi:hypothetical protein